MAFYFDLLIIGYLLAALVLFIVLWHDLCGRRKFWEKRHSLLTTTLLFFLAISWLIVFYGSFIEPKIIVINQTTIDLPNYQGEPIRLALISDLHAGPYKKSGFFERVAGKIQKLAPDAVLIIGDLVYNQPKDIKYLTPLKKVTDQTLVFAVLGDHDCQYEKRQINRRNQWIPNDESIKLISDKLAEMDIRVLENEAILLQNRIWLIGLKDILSGQSDLTGALMKTNDGQPRLVLAHNPDVIFDPASQKADLILTGHTHGGQIRLPLIGPMAFLPTHLGQKYDQGLFRLGTTQLFITSGVGESAARARLFDPPEIALITIF